ncbi:hypothetical protein H0H92_006629 [Tricholoma furcatifolium]|nr:hypothetical protein H0H92_006629 [Tricholoma furcatifolium]
MSEDRSQSRGRDAFQSSGRGGSGNIRQASVSRDTRPIDGPDDFSTSRGREPISSFLKSLSTGRGGAGNIRSPSRDPVPASALRGEPTITEEQEKELIRARNAANTEGRFSSGRGGSGNILQNESRSRSRDPALVHSTGRGGAGNIASGTLVDAYVAEVKDDEERKIHHDAHEIGLHSTGRGGRANIIASPEPPVEHLVHTHHQGDFESRGRGGAGNIVRG